MNLLRKNFIYNNLLGFTNILVPLIIFPYISRVFGPLGLGKVSFAIALTTTFVIVGSLGIPIYGIREIAKVKKDKELLSKTFLEIILIQVIWLSFILVLYFFWLQYTNTFSGELVMKIASFFHIIGVIGLINWFYQGLENYRFIAIVNFGVRSLTIILMFALINLNHQYWLYYSILVFSTFLGGTVSIVYLKKYLSLNLKNLNFRRHIKAIGVLFGIQIAIAVYTSMDVVFLKYFSNDEQVGFFSPAVRLIKVSTLMITSIGTVLIPKLSDYIQNNKIKECNVVINKSIKYVLFLSFPLIFLIWLYANDIIFLFVGDKFLNSVLLLRLLSPLILLTGMSNVFGLQVLISFHKERLFLYSVGLGALISIPLNIILMSKFESLGAAYSILITEFIITILTFYFARKTLKFKYPIKSGMNYLFLSLFFVPISLISAHFFDQFIFMVINTFFCMLLYVLGLLILKDSFFIENIWTPFLKIKNK
jgi:O-antigen/teichoic acid export membrane protein